MNNLNKTVEITTLAVIIPVIVSDEDIFKLYQDYHSRDIVFSKLPYWTINKNKGANNPPIQAEYYHQFTGQIKEDEIKEYIFFDIETFDDNLNEEFSCVGKDEVLKHTDFEKVFENRKIYKLSEFRLNKPIYLIIEITYDTYYDSYNGGYEGDVNYETIGYLDEKLNKIIL